jgi:peptidoglycan/xylan/chitin deacetylase (PgdA/CDA1 family)
VPIILLKKRKLILISVSAVALSAVLVIIFFANYATLHRPDNRLYIPILMYHSISDTPIGTPELSVTQKAFDEQMHYLTSNGYTPINLDEIDNCSQYKKPIVITFDDGYVDNFNCAYPILKKYNIKATIFMVTKYIGLGGFLSKDQIVNMGDLVSFESHTVDHVRLDRYNLDQVDFECRESQRVLHGITGKPIYAISYPNGMFTAPILRIAAKYYSFAVTTLPGKNTQHCDRLQLRRIGVLRDATMSDFIRSLK